MIKPHPGTTQVLVDQQRDNGLSAVPVSATSASACLMATVTQLATMRPVFGKLSYALRG